MGTDSQPTVTTWDSNPRSYAVDNMVEALQGWADTVKKLAKRSGQNEAAQVAGQVKMLAEQLEQLLVQPVVKKGAKAPDAAKLSEFGIKIG